jgi:hypothetical protein
MLSPPLKSDHWLLLRLERDQTILKDQIMTRTGRGSDKALPGTMAPRSGTLEMVTIWSSWSTFCPWFNIWLEVLTSGATDSQTQRRGPVTCVWAEAELLRF